MRPLLLTPESRELEWGSDMPRESFTTIDDCLELAQELFSRLHKLSNLKHPLDVRRGVKAMVDQNNARMVKAATRTYFFDLKTTQEGKKFLMITESRLKGEGTRSEILLFPEDAANFVTALQEMTGKL